MIPGLHRLRERFDAILFDLDGTLLDRGARVTWRTHRAVRRLVEAGFRVILCTGRSVSGSLSVYRGLELRTALAAYNGGWIGWPGRRPWRYAPIPDALVAEIERTESFAAFSFRHNGERKFTVKREHELHDRVSSWYENVVTVPHEDHLPHRDLMRVSCYYDTASRSDEAWESMSDEARDALIVQRYPMRIFAEFEDADLHLGELQVRTRGKAEVYDFLQQEHGIPTARTIAVGDQRNDLTMLEGAGLAVCVANAVEEARARADLVIGHHDREGIARWIEAGAPLDPGEVATVSRPPEGPTA